MSQALPEPADVQQANTEPPKQPKAPRYKQVTPQETETILAMREKGRTITDIAIELNRSTETIHRTLSAYQPTINLGRQKLDASWLKLVENVVRNGSPTDHARLVGRKFIEQNSNIQLSVLVNGIELHGSGVPQGSIEGEVVSPPQLPEQSESRDIAKE